MKKEEEKTKLLEKLLKLFENVERVDLKSDDGIQEISKIYNSLSEKEKLEFFNTLLHSYDISKEQIMPIVNELIQCDPNDPQWPHVLAKLREITLSPRFRKLRSLVRWPGGLKFLLDLRGDILALSSKAEPQLYALDKEISFIFENWFQEGFLYLEEITLDSPYRQIEIIKNRDLVHPMTSIEEMGDRLGRDRRCFALYHKIWPYEPIVFIEVALTEGIIKSIHDIVGPEKKSFKNPDTAIFYSINNTQNGLAGLGLGKVLIFKVVDFIRKKEPEIKNFATLSPLPGFYKRYLRPVLLGEKAGFKLNSKILKDFFSRSHQKRLYELAGKPQKDLATLLLEILETDTWYQQEYVTCLEEPLRKLAYFYVAEEKTEEGKPLNPVANFHLSNGASVHMKYINFLGNRSERALRDSLGFMVNYVYSFSWLTNISKAIRWLDRVEIKGLVERWF